MRTWEEGKGIQRRGRKFTITVWAQFGFSSFFIDLLCMTGTRHSSFALLASSSTERAPQ